MPTVGTASHGETSGRSTSRNVASPTMSDGDPGLDEPLRRVA